MRIKIDDGDFKKMINILEDIPDDVADDAYDFFRKQTPIRSGNARNKTRQNGKTIDANYAYAGRLDEGYSKQSPRGMSDPTVDFIQKEIDKRVRRV